MANLEWVCRDLPWTVPRSDLNKQVPARAIFTNELRGPSRGRFQAASRARGSVLRTRGWRGCPLLGATLDLARNLQGDWTGAQHATIVRPLDSETRPCELERPFERMHVAHDGSC